MSFVGMTSISVNVYWPDSMINKQTRTVHLKFYCCSSFHCPLIFSECLRFENSSWDFLSFTLVPGIFSGFASNPRDFLGVNCYDPIRTSPSLLIQSIPLSIHPPPPCSITFDAAPIDENKLPVYISNYWRRNGQG